MHVQIGAALATEAAGARLVQDTYVCTGSSKLVLNLTTLKAFPSLYFSGLGSMSTGSFVLHL